MGGEREGRENIKHQRRWRRKKWKIKSRCHVPLSKYTDDKARYSYRQKKAYTNSRFSCQEVKDLTDRAVQMPLWSEVPNTTSSSLPFLIQCLISQQFHSKKSRVVFSVSFSTGSSTADGKDGHVFEHWIQETNQETMPCRPLSPILRYQ